MELSIHWTLFAENELYNIFKYYLKEAGYTTAKILTDGIYNEPFKLVNQPEIGQTEELLKGSQISFRYLL